MGVHRLKHNFTAGEITPLLTARTDFERFNNGCKKLYNMVCATQGPATRRPGLQFIYSLNDLGLDVTNPQVRAIPFIFSENQAYAMIFFRHTNGKVRMVLGSNDGLVVFSATPPAQCPPGTPVSYTPGDIVTLEMPTGWDIENFDWAQSADEMHIAQSGLQPHIIRRYSHECWTVVAITFTNQPTDWSAVNGWPKKVTFHQQRLAFGSNTLRPQTCWLSKAGDLYNFGVSSPVIDSDAVTFTLNSSTQNKINWLSSGKALYLGTIGNEWTVQGGTQTAITPTNILAQKQTNSGSNANKPLSVGLTTLFIERHGRSINEFTYDYNYDSYDTADLSVLAPHIAEQYSFIDWTYQQTPDSIIWLVREDGDLAGITYQRQHKVIGWHVHDTLGAFKAITCVPGETREDDVWTVIKRVINGQDKYYIEKMADQFLADEAEWSRFLDCHAVYQGTPTSTISGLDFLEGEEVHILADGTVHPVRTVSDGSVTLNDEYSHIVVGLPYVSEVRPVMPDLPMQDGTALGRVRRATNIDILLYKTLGCTIGKIDDETGEEKAEDVAFRVPTDLTGQQVPLFSGTKHIAFLEGYDRDPVYFIRQAQPLPLTVLGIIDTIEVYE